MPSRRARWPPGASTQNVGGTQNRFFNPFSRVGRNRRKEIKPTVVVGSESPVPTPHQTGRTDFPYPAFRVQFGSSVTTAATVSVGDFASTRLIPLQGLRPRPSADVWTSILPSLRS